MAPLVWLARSTSFIARIISISIIDLQLMIKMFVVDEDEDDYYYYYYYCGVGK